MNAVSALAIDNLTVRTDTGRRLLQVDRLHVPAAQVVAIRGPSGAGKSTMLNAIAGLQSVSSGHLRWGDTDLAGLSERRRADFRRRTFGVIFQDHHLLEEFSAEENAALAAFYAPAPERSGIKQRAREVLAQFGIEDSKLHRVHTFSGGERQRVAVARALAHNPPVLLADEPTASLDRQAADGLIETVLADVRRHGRTMIVVSHDPALIAAVDRVLTIRDGLVTGDESPANA
jgi:ABC-type lipoprotein export system ATPase subunit